MSEIFIFSYFFMLKLDLTFCSEFLINFESPSSLNGTKDVFTFYNGALKTGSVLIVGKVFRFRNPQYLRCYLDIFHVIKDLRVPF